MLDIKGYIIAILAVCIIIASSLAIWMYNAKEGIQSDYDKLNAVLEVAGADMTAKANEFPAIQKQIEYRTQQKIQVVKEYVYDNNQSECNNAIALLRRTGF